MLIVNDNGNNLQYDNIFKEQFDLENKSYIVINDGSALAKSILSAHEYELTFDDEIVVGVKVLKTIEQYQAEQPTPDQQPTEIELLRAEVNELKTKMSKVETDVKVAKLNK